MLHETFSGWISSPPSFPKSKNLRLITFHLCASEKHPKFRCALPWPVKSSKSIHATSAPGTLIFPFKEKILVPSTDFKKGFCQGCLYKWNPLIYVSKVK